MDFLTDFSTDFVWNRRRISLGDLPKPCRAKSLRGGLPHKFSLIVGSLLFSGCAGLTRQSRPPPKSPDSWSGWEACHHANATLLPTDITQLIQKIDSG